MFEKLDREEEMEKDRGERKAALALATDEAKTDTINVDVEMKHIHS